MKSGNLKFLEPSGPLQACNGTALRYVAHIYALVNLLYTELIFSIADTIKEFAFDIVRCLRWEQLTADR